jgi:urease accessory protein
MLKGNKVHIPRIGIGGPVGSGKTRLIELLVPILDKKGYRCCIISNDIISKEDAQRLQRTLAVEAKIMPQDMIIAVATGGCPHTAIREDPSINLSVIHEIEQKDPSLDLIIIESGGDNTMTTFSPSIADFFIYIIDVAGGDKYPRKGGLGIEKCDLLVVNKIDLATHVGADLSIMKRDAKLVRGGGASNRTSKHNSIKPFEFVSCKFSVGIERIAKHIIDNVLFDKKPLKRKTSTSTKQISSKKSTI